ncbi:hypothetical protein [Pseudanabaena galeata]|uniref:hypothetical protein n=1 Tax=Pseudanabaena galeata TaxID=1112103 RepID=UPI002B205910|nr:hypothetical protein [Pseudanabaena galeata]
MIATKPITKENPVVTPQKLMLRIGGAHRPLSSPIYTNPVRVLKDRMAKPFCPLILVLSISP